MLTPHGEIMPPAGTKRGSGDGEINYGFAYSPAAAMVMDVG